MQATYFQISDLASALQWAHSTDSVAIRPSGNGIHVHVWDASLYGRIRRIIERVIYSVGSWVGYAHDAPDEATPSDARDTQEFFERVFGARRIVRIYQRCDIDVSGRGFVREDVEKLFMDAAEVRMEDLEELFFELQDASRNTVRFLSRDETETVRMALRGAETVHELSKRALDFLMNVLVPFLSKADIFLHNTPDIDPEWSLTLTKYGLRRRRTLAIEQLRRGDLRGTDRAVYLAKRLAGHAIEPGMLISHPRGYLESITAVSGGGATKLFFRFFGADAAGRSCVLYRGTCDGASFTDDLREEMGSLGPVETYEETEALLLHPERGFVRTQDEPVDAIGFSLGGVHAQRDSLLFPWKITRVTTVCAPGVDRATALLYAERVRHQKRPVAITHYTEVGDLASELGEAKLGLEVSADGGRVVAIATQPLPSPALHEHLVRLHPRLPLAWPVTPLLNMSTMLLEIIESVNSHNRTTPMASAVRYTLSNGEAAARPYLARFLGQQAPKAPIWERIRRACAIPSNGQFVHFAESVNLQKL